MRGLRRALDWIVNAFTWIACVAAGLMMLHVTVDVIGRTVFNHPLTGTVEIVSAYDMAALAFLPLALLTRERDHIIVELFTTWMSRRGRTLLDAFVAILSLAYVSVFTWRAIVVAIDKTAIGEAREAGVGYIPVWPSRWLVPLGFGFMAIYLLIYIIRDFRAVKTGRFDKPESTELDIPPEDRAL